MAASSTFKITDNVRDVLARSVITETTVKLPEQLDRALYAQVDKALRGAGGRWNRVRRVHVFDRDPREVLGLAVETGEAINLRQKLQSFYTPPPLAKRVVEAADLKHEMLVLEPSAGEGALAAAALRHAAVRVVMYDIDEVALARALGVAEKIVRDSGGSVRGRVQDFLTVMPEHQLYDAVIMNPPFTRGADMAHVTHGWRFVKPGGVLVSVMSPAFQHQSSKAAKELRALLASATAHENAFVDIPAGTFEHTTIATVMVVMRKPK